MIKAAVLGSPISHSLSPLIHRKAYEILGLEGDYSAIEIDLKGFPNFFERASSENWNGFSLTMPLKEAPFEMISDIDPISTRIRSVNTLIQSGGHWRALSTDFLAFKSLINLSKGSQVAIIGGGGTARAAIGALEGHDTCVDVMIRSKAREDSLSIAAGDLELNFLPLSGDLEKYDFVVSTVPKGVMDPFAPTISNTNGALLECLYAPWPTQLAKKWQELGGEVISGIDLLVEQALHQINLMTGVDFDFDVMRKLLLVEAWGSQEN